MTIRSLRDLHRVLRSALPGGDAPATWGPPLEITAPPADPPRLEACEVIEGSSIATHKVHSVSDPRFDAFLDGVQESRAIQHFDGTPIVAARIAAVIRTRIERRMVTWPDGVRSAVRLYAPQAHMPPSVWHALSRGDVTVVDTAENLGDATPHPLELLQRALQRVNDDRQSLERELAERWCQVCSSPLYVDGGLPRGTLSSISPWCVGVVKSHHTLYVDGDGLRTVLSLPAETRSSVFRVARNRRPDAASWYLRFRDARMHDPMWGLVRVEVALTPDLDSAEAIRARADTVSGWILAERTPLSLPDGRWDRMVYGIRDCEMFLRAIA